MKLSNEKSNSFIRKTAPSKTRKNNVKLRKTRISEKTKKLLQSTLFIPFHIQNIALATGQSNLNHQQLKSTCNRKIAILGKVYRYIFWPKLHIIYYRHEAKLKGMKLNDYLDGVIEGKFPMCDNNDERYLMTDVKFLQENPHHYIKRDGMLLGIENIDLLKKLEKEAIKSQKLPNNIMPNLACPNLKEYVYNMEHPQAQVESITDSNNDCTSCNATESNLDSETNTTQNSVNTDDEYLDPETFSTVIKDSVSEPVESSKSNSTKSSNGYTFSILDDLFTGKVTVDINKILNSKTGPKPKDNKHISLPTTIEKNFYSSFLFKHIFNSEDLTDDLIESFQAVGCDLATAQYHTETTLGIASTQIINESLVYDGGATVQQSHALGLDSLLNADKFIEIFKIISKDQFLLTFNQLRLKRLKSYESLFCDHTTIAHETKNNDYSKLTLNFKKEFITGVSTTIGISDKLLTPAFLKISSGSIND